MTLLLSHETRIAIKANVLARFPQEACGLIIGGDYYECQNTHEKPTEYFRIDGRQRIELSLDHGPIQAVIHSHPFELKNSKQYLARKYNPAWPSVGDQTSFMADNVDWGIVATSGEGITDINWLSQKTQPLESRSFAWFTADCYTAVRDWHALNTKIVMPNFTREWGFWEKGINTIEVSLATLNAERVPVEKAQVGDIAAFALSVSGIINHLGVLSGNNEFTHQFVQKYCVVDRWDRWKQRARYMIRLRNE